MSRQKSGLSEPQGITPRLDQLGDIVQAEHAKMHFVNLTLSISACFTGRT